VSKIFDFEADDIAAAQFAIDRKIEQRQVSRSISDLKSCADGLYMLGLERRLCTGQPALVPRFRGSRLGFEMFVFHAPSPFT
jgi:hypothetical protein